MTMNNNGADDFPDRLRNLMGPDGPTPERPEKTVWLVALAIVVALVVVGTLLLVL